VLNIDIIAISISSIALVISILVYFQNRQHHRQNVLIFKIERIISILKKHTPLYERFLELALNLDEVNNPKTNDPTQQKSYNKLKGKIIKHIDVKTVIDECRELEVLSESYLTGKTKLKVSCFASLMLNIIGYSMEMEKYYADIIGNDGFPETNPVINYVDGLINVLIEEIGFIKGTSDFKTRLREYFDNDFKTALGVIKNKNP